MDRYEEWKHYIMAKRIMRIMAANLGGERLGEIAKHDRWSLAPHGSYANLMDTASILPACVTAMNAIRNHRRQIRDDRPTHLAALSARDTSSAKLLLERLHGGKKKALKQFVVSLINHGVTDNGVLHPCRPTLVNSIADMEDRYTNSMPVPPYFSVLRHRFPVEMVSDGKYEWVMLKMVDQKSEVLERKGIRFFHAYGARRTGPENSYLYLTKSLRVMVMGEVSAAAEDYAGCLSLVQRRFLQHVRKTLGGKDE